MVDSPISDRVRQRAGEYFASSSFDVVFKQLHPFTFSTLLLGGMLLPLVFQFEAAKASWRRIFDGDIQSRRLRKRYARLARSGKAIFTFALISNISLQRTPGVVAPALVVGNFNDGRDDLHVMKLQEKLADLALGLDVKPSERGLAKMLADLDYRFQRRRHFSNQGVRIIAFDLMVPGELLPTETLEYDLIPCLAEPGRKGLIAMMPSHVFLD